jgi:hypothetical protein
VKFYLFRIVALIFWGLSICPQAPSVAGSPKEVPPTFTAPQTVEAWRIRLENYVQGPISISTDGGVNWQVIGRVTAPATRNLTGYLAAGYAPLSTVAATAVHGIRIRVGDTTTAYPALINIVPAEFAQTPNYYGGHISGASGIYTDIPTGTAIFREFAPSVGNVMLVKTLAEGYRPLPVNYSPAVNDSYMIIVTRPVNEIHDVVIENKEGGDVTVTYENGESSVVTHVAKPVAGVGRFDGCSYTGVGAINTNHTCVITVSTAPVTKLRELEGVGSERRGGFQIVPSYHNSQTEEAGAPQMLVLGTPKSHTPEIEGTPPLFSGYFNLSWMADDPGHSWICSIRRGGGTTWEPMPELIGNLPDAFARLGVSAFRIAREQGSGGKPWMMARAAADVYAYLGRRAALARAGKDEIARGTTLFYATSDQLQVPAAAVFAQFYLDGEMVGLTNSRPYQWTWNTTHVADGEHTVESRLLDENGAVILRRNVVYWVDNLNAIKPVATASAPGG